jgi:hypothetical protein
MCHRAFWPAVLLAVGGAAVTGLIVGRQPGRRDARPAVRLHDAGSDVKVRDP